MASGLSFGALAALSALSSAGGYILGGASSSRAMKKQYEYNRMLMQQQFDYQKYLVQHAHQFEVADLRQAGLNPVLSANNGATTSVGLNSASAIDNSANMANTLADSINTAALNATSARSVANQKPVQDATVRNLDAQTITEDNKRKNLDSQTRFNNLKSEGKAIENLWLPKQIKADLKYKNDMAQAALIGADAKSSEADTSAKSYKLNKEVQDIVRDKESRYKQWGEKHPIWRNVDETLSRYFGGFSSSAALSKKLK